MFVPPRTTACALHNISFFSIKIRFMKMYSLQHEKSGILVGFELTKHYWMNIATFITLLGIPFDMVNPHQVNILKRLDFGKMEDGYSK